MVPATHRRQMPSANIVFFLLRRAFLVNLPILFTHRAGNVDSFFAIMSVMSHSYKSPRRPVAVAVKAGAVAVKAGAVAVKAGAVAVRPVQSPLRPVQLPLRLVQSP